MDIIRKINKIKSVCLMQKYIPREEALIPIVGPKGNQEGGVNWLSKKNIAELNLDNHPKICASENAKISPHTKKIKNV